MRNMTFEEKAKVHNSQYIDQTDVRVKKPIVFFHHQNCNKRIFLPNNWILESDKLETMMDTPNDVAIYSSISFSHLNIAKEFHRKEIIPRKQSGFGSKTLLKPELTVYYNYFETIITAVIFAYSSIEAFANICIPLTYNYSYTNKGNNVVFKNKEKIERTVSLREKLKKILPEIIGCQSPEMQKWWPIFTELEDLRDEIIHCKESKSEDRYSKLLSTSIIKKVEVHKEVFEFFGNEISTRKKELLDEYPNGFGHDYYNVKKLSDVDYKKSIEEIGL